MIQILERLKELKWYVYTRDSLIIADRDYVYVSMSVNQKKMFISVGKRGIPKSYKLIALKYSYQIYNLECIKPRHNYLKSIFSKEELKLFIELMEV